MSQVPGPKDSIFMVAELLANEPDFSLEEVEANVQAAVDEHPRLRQILTADGLWEDVVVDIPANHLRWIDEVPGKPDPGEPIVEEGSELLHALANMPAFQDSDGYTPRWQVIVMKRKLVFDIHHAAVDGVGIAMIAGTLVFGKHLEETVQTMVADPAKSASARPQPGSCDRFGQACCGLKSFCRHLSTPAEGLLCAKPQSAISNPASEADVKDIRYLHLGPYPLDALKSAARSSGVTINSTLLSALTAGLQDYCAAHDGHAPAALSVAVPVSFKQPNPENPDSMKANNDFSTMVVSLPTSGHSEEEDSDNETSLLRLNPADWSGGNALGAWAAQAALSLLPMWAVRWIVHSSSRIVSFIFSNVNGSAFGDTFVSRSTGVHKRIRAYAYGSLNGTVRVFLLADSHGQDLHLGLTVDRAVVADRQQLAACLHRRLLSVCQL